MPVPFLKIGRVNTSVPDVNSNRVDFLFSQ